VAHPINAVANLAFPIHLFDRQFTKGPISSA
jgi:hypothetical protein